MENGGRGGSWNQCRQIYSSSYPGVVGPFSTQLVLSFHEEGTERKGEWRWREGGSEARGGSGNRCSHICSGPYLDLVGPFSTQLISSFLKERWGAYGGVGAVVDAATSVPVPTLV